MTVVSASWLPHSVHRAAMYAIRRTPILSRTSFKAYHKLSKPLVRETTARTYFGSLIKGDVRDIIMEYIFYFGIWEPNNSKLIEQILSPGDTFVDVGANIGYDSLLAAKLVGSSGRVVAIEASPRIFEQLRGNLDLNKATNVRLVNKAAASVPGELTLYAGKSGNQGETSTLPRLGQVAEAVIQAEPLDEILTPEELASLRLLKMDIEGAEIDVLKRLLATLDKYPRDMQLMVEFSPQDVGVAESRTVFDDLRAAGFEAFEVKNLYNTEWYLTWRELDALVPLKTLPTKTCDVLFRRPASPN